MLEKDKSLCCEVPFTVTIADWTSRPFSWSGVFWCGHDASSCSALALSIPIALILVLVTSSCREKCFFRRICLLLKRMQATISAIKTAANTRTTGMSVSGPGTDEGVVAACVGGSLSTVVVEAVVGGSVAVSLEPFIVNGAGSYDCRCYSLKYGDEELASAACFWLNP